MQPEEPLKDSLLHPNTLKDSQAPLNQEQEKAKGQYFKHGRLIFGQNLLQNLFYTWVSPVLAYGNKVILGEESIPQLRDKDLPKVDFNKLSQTFEKEVRSSKSKAEGMTLTRAIFKAFRKEFIIVFILSFFIIGMQMYQPILSHDVIAYIAESQRSTQTGLLYFFGIFVLSLTITISQTYLWYVFAIIGFNLANTLSLSIYTKALMHPLISQKQFQIGDIINYSQVDAQRMTYMGYELVALLYTPLQLFIGFYLLYSYIGISFLVGLGVMVVLMGFTLISSRIATKANDDMLKAKDARMKAAEEMLNIIKFIKTNALEKYFFQKINRKREQELGLIKKVNLCYVANIFVYWLCPPTIVSLTFLTYILLGNDITAAKAFFTIIIFNILQYPIRLLPSAIAELLQIWSSVKRIEKFMKASELTKDIIEENKEDNQRYAVEIDRGYFLWGREKKKDKDKNKTEKSGSQGSKSIRSYSSSSPTKKVNQNQTQTETEERLKESLLSENENERKSQIEAKDEKYFKALRDINIKFPTKAVTMIIGDIGSGKSSLLYAILNEMTPDREYDPRITVNGSVAYCPQKAWIMAGTVRENILFFQPYDEQRLREAIHFACLEDDLRILNKGLETEIGEKGVNLSGGQKARISLARALYSGRDVYLLDDVLSAVDVHVGKFLMEKTILEYLRDKTVIMPTHAVKYLDRADNVVIMKNGRIVTSGPYSQVAECDEFRDIMDLQLKKQSKQQKKSKQEQKLIADLKKQKQVINDKLKKSMVDQQKTQVAVTDQIVEQLIVTEDHLRGQVDIGVYKEYVKNSGGPLFILSVIFALSAWMVMSLLSNIQIERWCESDVKDKKYLFLYLVLAVGSTFFSGARAYILITGSIRQGRMTHKKVIKALLYTSITRFYNRVPLGRILNRLSKDLKQIDESMGFVVGGFLVCMFSMTASLLMCLYASTFYVLIPIVLVGLASRMVLRYYLNSQRQIVRLENITSSPIVSGFTSTVNGVCTIRAYRLEAEFLERQLSKVGINKRMRICKQAMESWFSLRLSLLSFIINMSAMGYCVMSQNQNASLAGLLLTYAGLLNDDIIGTAYSYAKMELKMISVERVGTFIKLEPEQGYAEYCKNWRTKEEGSNMQAITQGSIEFKDYSSRYRDGLPLVIKKLNIQINKGQKVGIVGRTGAGKSTLTNCLLRILEPAEGQILIDGKSILEYSLKDLRSCITMIEQEPTLMNGSFRDNLDPAAQYSDEEVGAILRECNLAELVTAKGGLDAKVTNENLSVGERQLLCICRAFLKRSRIILVDEATANIDVRNDRLIQEVIATAFRDSTVLTIAHRLSTLQNCDKILVMGEGRALEWGTRTELLQRPGGIYRQMCEQNDSSYLL